MYVIVQLWVEFYRSICYSRNLLNKNYCIIQTIDRTSCCFVVCFGRRIYLYFYLFLHFCTSTINFCDYYYYYFYYYYCYRLSSVHTSYIDLSCVTMASRAHTKSNFSRTPAMFKEPLKLNSLWKVSASQKRKEMRARQ